MNDPLGDLSPEDFARSANFLTEWLSDYLAPESRPEPILSQVSPGQIRERQSVEPPLEGTDALGVLREFQNELSDGLTHWNSPRFFGYFSISASIPGVLADFLSSGLNQQAMLWRTSPVATELEQVTLDWLPGHGSSQALFWCDLRYGLSGHPTRLGNGSGQDASRR